MKYRVKKIDFNDMSLNERLSVKRLMNFHSIAGYIIISAFNQDNEKSINNRQSNQLKGKIKQSGFSYVPVWGGWVYKDEEGGESSKGFEKSFIVFNYKRKDKQENIDELETYAKKWCKEFKQWAYFIKEMGKKSLAYYKDENGKIDSTFDIISPTEASDEYFTSLCKSKSKLDDDRTLKAFTFRDSKYKSDEDEEDEIGYDGNIYLPVKPNSLAEAYSRSGEIFFDWK